MARAGLDRTSVVQAAADLIGAEGVEALSLGRLAQRLGVQTPSLYNHVQGLPGLYRELRLLNARSLGEALSQAAAGRSGAQAVKAVAQAYRQHIKRNPGLYAASLRASGNLDQPDPELAASEGRIVQTVLAVIASFGLTGADALHAVRGLRSLVHGFATLEVSGGFGLPLDLDESFHRLLTIYITGLEAAPGA